MMSSEKKCKIIESSLGSHSSPLAISILRKTKDEGMNKENMHTLLAAIRKGGSNRIGSLFKADYQGGFIPAWMDLVDQSQLQKIEIGSAIGLLLSLKDTFELDLCKRASVLSNKVMKHGFVQRMESIVDTGEKIKHDALANEIEGIIFDPSKIGIKINADVEICYTPIIQSGGSYDIKVSAQSNGEIMKPDLIICSLGARYKGYCANVSRTFMVDAPKKVEDSYSLLVALYDSCLEQMVVGNELKDVFQGAKTFLNMRSPDMLTYLPKSLGFAIGLEFRDSTLVLNEKSQAKFAEDMLFTLSVGFHNVPLTAEEKKGAGESSQKLSNFSLLLADTVRIQKDAVPEVLTKISKDYGDVSYSIEDKEAHDEGDADEDMDVDENGVPVRRSSRFSKQEREETEQKVAVRDQKQAELRQKKIDEARRKLERKRTSGGGGAAADDEDLPDVADLKVYKSTEEYPKDVMPNRVMVDRMREALILPINGRPVPFHMSTIKSVTRPEEGKAAYMRVNFNIPTSAASVSKDMPKNMQQLIVKYGDSSHFIKEMTFKAQDPSNLAKAYRDFMELKKAVRAKEQRAEQEKDIVVQAKLIKIKDQRVPRLQDVIMRPQISGRKCVGELQAHQNGLRFTSTRGETIDLLYNNIKHAIYQPCDKTTIVLVHFHLKEFIMVGKKKQKDITFYADVIEGSLNLEGARRSAYDPDELAEEQRERDMKKKLNNAFKEFCLKLEKVAEHYQHTIHVEVPFRRSGFFGNCHREMVFVVPTKSCVVNLTETPAFLITLAEVDHVHFERVTYGGNHNFDVTFIFKNWDILPRTVTAVEIKSKEGIEEWLTLSGISYGEGRMNVKWDDMINKIARDQGDYFYLDEDEDGNKKPPGWLFLDTRYSLDDEDEGEEEEDEESSYSGSGSGGSGGSDDDSDESDDDDDDDDESEEYANSDEEGDDDDEDEDEEEGEDWDTLEKKAAESDRKREREREVEDTHARKKVAPPRGKR